jgi:hypothetical protein
MVVKPKHVAAIFNVNFNVLLSKYVVHPLVKIKESDNMHGTTTCCIQDGEWKKNIS